MIILIYRLGNEFCRFQIDRVSKRFWFQSRKTGYKLLEMPWHMLFDKGKKKEQDKITENLPDPEFMLAISGEMVAQGYRIQKAEING